MLLSMKESGSIIDRDKYSDLFLRITRAAGILVPIAAISYGFFVMQGIGERSPLYNYSASIIVFVLFAILAIAQYIVKPRTPLSLGVFVALYHVFGAAYLIACPGIIGPIVFCWIVLTLITEIFYGRNYAVLSLAAITATFLFLYLSEPVVTTQDMLLYPMYLIIIIVSSILIGLLRRVQIVEHQDLKRTQTQEQLQRGQLTTLINSVGMAIVSTSGTGTIRVYNAALLSLLDTNDSLTGKKLGTALHLYDSDGKPVEFEHVTSQVTHQIEREDLYHRFDDGESIRLSISAAPIRGKFGTNTNQREGFIFIIRDITREKSLEEERDEFISVVSHELRTPITITEGTLSNLRFLLESGKDPVTLSESLKEAHEQIVYLANMVNDLSTLSRAERSVADAPEDVDVRELCEELYHRYQPKAAEKNIVLHLDLGHRLRPVSVSRLYLEEILQNFITNAIKYTQQGSVTLSVAHRNGHTEFAVQDSGIGISKTDQKKIFNKFYRSEDYRTRETSGTGLGLYVVRKLADKLDTEIKVESRLNHGSTFHFALKDSEDSSTA